MNWNSIWQMTSAIIVSVGGAGGIILAISKWLANITAERMLKKLEFKYSKDLEDFKNNLEIDLEDFKSKLDTKNYISKTRFDLEINIYQQLSEKFLSMIYDTGMLYPSGITYKLSDSDAEIKKMNENYDKVIISFNEANSILMKNSPFISEDIYQLFEDIRNDCNTQIKTFFDNKYGVFKGIEKDELECFVRTSKIYEKRKALVKKLREHLNSLEVLDN